MKYTSPSTPPPPTHPPLHPFFLSSPAGTGSEETKMTKRPRKLHQHQRHWSREKLRYSYLDRSIDGRENPSQCEDLKTGPAVRREIQIEESTRIVCRRSCEKKTRMTVMRNKSSREQGRYQPNGQLAREESTVPQSLNTGNLVKHRKKFSNLKRNSSFRPKIDRHIA